MDQARPVDVVAIAGARSSSIRGSEVTVPLHGIALGPVLHAEQVVGEQQCCVTRVPAVNRLQQRPGEFCEEIDDAGHALIKTFPHAAIKPYARDVANEDFRVRTGRIEPHTVEALAGLLDSPIPEQLPPMWHVTQLLDVPPQLDIGRDGHPRSGLPSPPREGMRRMFAGGRAYHRRPLVVDGDAERRSRVVSRQEKNGRAGTLTFVTVRHELWQGGDLAVADEHDIVYLPTRGGGKPLPATGGGEQLEGRIFDVDAVVLFRFSALTYNAHRIHYDRQHAADEGFADLVVHGPLQVLLMAEALEGLFGSVLEYRLIAPAIGPQRLTIRTPGDDGADAEVRAGNGTAVARATVTTP
jgi:3-methylfumaryl-CoA hydratase